MIVRTLCALAALSCLATPALAQALSSPHLGAGWATFGLVLPRGAASAGVMVGSLTTQTDVKTRWPDGSIRFAVVTARVPAAGDYAVTPAPARAGVFAPRWPDAQVKLTLPSGTYTARVAPPSSDTWLDGPLVREWRMVAAPTGPGGPHPFLRVVVDTRVYENGEARLDVAVENVLDVSGATSATYNVEVVHNGQAVFSKPGVSHPWLTRWRKVVHLSGLVPSAVTPDFAPTVAAGAMPRYLSTVRNTIDTPQGPRFDILGVGSLNPKMADAGGRPEIAPYPDWVARYVVHRDATQGRFVLAHGDLAGSWPVHIREADGRFVSIDQRPTFWLDGRCEKADGRSCPRGNLAGTGSLLPDKAHQPSLAYVPYLITGDRYYADEMAFWANYALISTWPPERHDSKGLINYYEIRGFAWTLRNLGDAVAYMPDTEPSKKFFLAKLTANLKWADDYADGKVVTGRVGQPLHPLGISFYYEDGGYLKVAEWENYYLAWTLDHLADQGFAGGTKLRDRIARLLLQMFTSQPDFPLSCAITYRPVVGRSPSRFFTSMREFARDGACHDTRDIADGHWGLWARPMLMIAVKQGWPRSVEAWDYMMSYKSKNGTILERANEFAGWALARHDEPVDAAAALPAAVPTLPDGEGSLLALSMSAAPPPIAAASSAATETTAASVPEVVEGPRTTTITFDDLPGTNLGMAGEHPVGLVDWGNTYWYLSAPLGRFTTKSVSFDGGIGPGVERAVFSLLTPQVVVKLDAYNGGSDPSSVTLRCRDQRKKTLKKTFKVAVNQPVTLETGWTDACVGVVTVDSSNGWNTNFDNLVLVSGPTL